MKQAHISRNKLLFIFILLEFCCKITKNNAFREFFRQKVCEIQKNILPLHPQIRNDAHLLQ